MVFLHLDLPWNPSRPGMTQVVPTLSNCFLMGERTMPQPFSDTDGQDSEVWTWAVMCVKQKNHDGGPQLVTSKHTVTVILCWWRPGAWLPDGEQGMICFSQGKLEHFRARSKCTTPGVEKIFHTVLQFSSFRIRSLVAVETHFKAYGQYQSVTDLG